MSDIVIRAEREGPETHLLYSTAEEGTVTITLPGLTAIRIDPRTRTIAVDGTSGEAQGQPLIDWFLADLRSGIYGDFHRLRPREGCSDPDCAGSGQHNALYPHFHETVEEVADCDACMQRAADLRILADA